MLKPFHHVDITHTGTVAQMTSIYISLSRYTMGKGWWGRGEGLVGVCGMLGMRVYNGVTSE
jgi:hypothetical protein